MPESHIPAEGQIRAMLDGSICELLRKSFGEAAPGDFRKAITVDRARIIEFLKSHPAETDAYFTKHDAMLGTHDVERIWCENAMYVTCWMDHGEQRSIKHFTNLPEAVAEHVLVTHGMY
jgi:hypothetical protein